VNLRTADAAVLSHHHYDHGGGLPRFFALNSNAKVYLKKPPDGECYFKALLFRRRFIGLDRDLFNEYSARFAFIEEFTEILPDVYIFTNIGSTYPKPKGNRYLYVKRDSHWSLDTFAHELVMAIREHGKFGNLYRLFP
jgi:7,8-dihydropterin-6-yl-methyl-4-(beta-D-ribofuranosyl)aminobenzene 5'-phosphate synthase